jgi:hypothetical protein
MTGDKHFSVVGLGGCGIAAIKNLRSRFEGLSCLRTGTVATAPDAVPISLADMSLVISPERRSKPAEMPWWRRKFLADLKDISGMYDNAADSETDQFRSWFEGCIKEAGFCTVIGGIGNTSSVCLPAAVKLLEAKGVPHAQICLMPFSFENHSEKAVKIIAKLDNTDSAASTIFLWNDRVLEIVGPDKAIEDAFCVIDNAIFTLVSAFARKYKPDFSPGELAEEEFNHVTVFLGKEHADRIAHRFGLRLMMKRGMGA